MSLLKEVTKGSNDFQIRGPLDLAMKQRTEKYPMSIYETLL